MQWVKFQQPASRMRQASPSEEYSKASEEPDLVVVMVDVVVLALVVPEVVGQVVGSRWSCSRDTRGCSDELDQ